MNSLGIAVLIPGWYSFETTGGGKTILELVKAFQKFGADTLFLAPDNCKDYTMQKDELKSPLFLNLFNTPRHLRLFAFPFVIILRFLQIFSLYGKQISNFFSSQSLIIIFTHNDVVSTAFSAFAKKLFYKSKVVLVFPWYHVHDGLGGVLNLCALNFAKQIDILYTESSHNGINAKNSSEMFEEKSFVAGVGIDYAKYRKDETLEPKEYDACFVGRIHPCKGVFDLVRVWKTITAQYPKNRLAIVGEGLPVHEKELRALVAKEHLENNVVLTGYVSEKQKTRIISTSKVLVHPSYAECIPLVFLEAMVCKTPVVTYYLPTYSKLSDLIYCVNLGDEVGLANKIMAVLNHLHECNNQLKLQKSMQYASNSDWQLIAKRLLQKCES